MKRTLKERFLTKIFIDPTTGCWLWQGQIDSDGYALMHVGRKSPRAHRLAWTLFRGEIPAGLLVCHKCDIRFCVNPDHLFLGTHAENSADMTRKGRQRAGEKNPTARLKREQVLMIRGLLASGQTVTAIAKRFGLTVAAICHIKTGRNWAHVRLADSNQGVTAPREFHVERRRHD